MQRGGKNGRAWTDARTEVGLDGLLEGGELAAAGGALLEHGLEGPRDEPSRGARHGRGRSPPFLLLLRVAAGPGGRKWSGWIRGQGEDARSEERETEGGFGSGRLTTPPRPRSRSCGRGFQRIARTFCQISFTPVYFASARPPTHSQATPGSCNRRFGACAQGLVHLCQTGEHVDKLNTCVFVFCGQTCANLRCTPGLTTILIQGSVRMPAFE